MMDRNTTFVPGALSLAQPPVRVLIVDDSAVVREILKHMLESDPDIHVVGMAGNGVEAVALTSKLKPDLITMDLKMPHMDGMEATERIMAYCPTPILILTSYLDREGMYSSLDALAAGALDVLEKPTIVPDAQWQAMTGTLVDKVKLLARIRVIRHVQGKTRRRRGERRASPVADRNVEVVGIGVSTGGPKVLQQILSALPGDFSLSVLVVQHITEGFMSGLVDWLQPPCQLTVKIAAEGDAVLPGRVFFAPDSSHLVVASDGTLHLSRAEPVNGHRPSADVTLQSLAAAYGDRAAGVLLTGMGSDGAEGLRAVHEAGGLTLAQNEESCVVFGMPRAAIELGAAQHVLSLPDLTESLIALHRRRLRALSL